MILREVVGDNKIEYEGTPEEICEYFKLLRQSNESAIKNLVQNLIDKQYDYIDVSTPVTLVVGNYYRVKEDGTTVKCKEIFENGKMGAFEVEDGATCHYYADEVTDSLIN